jgi:DNA polymerase-3 subunit alpha
MCNNYVSIHTHSMYSVLDGLPSIDALVGKAVSLGMPALAITDHGAMYGVYEFYKKAKKAGIKPILGIEAYLNPWQVGMKSRSTKESYHLLMLAMNDIGYKNLVRLSSLSYTEGFYYKPRIDHETLKDYSEGIICTSGCLASEIPRLILSGKQDEAETRLGWYLNAFKDRFYIELQDHDIPELHSVNKVLVEFSKKFSIPLVATNDVHYVNQSDSVPHDYFLCVQTASKLHDSDRMKMNNDSYFLRSFEQMRELFVPEALANTVEIANRCSVSLESKGYHLPNFKIPVVGFLNHFDYLKYLVASGFEKMYGISLETSTIGEEIKLDAYSCKEENYVHKELNPDFLRKRVNYELGVIRRMNFEKYFLVVWDIIDYAKRSGILWNVRGSAAGSIVSYCLGLTAVEPVTNGLYFERFLNPDRVSMPDIDMDFPDDERAKLIDYTVDKYGADCVSQIITFGTMQARAAIKDVARVVGMPFSESNSFVALLPDAPNRQMTIRQAVLEVPELAEAYKDPFKKNIIDIAADLEGSVRNVGTHAAGIVISDSPITNYVPLHRVTGKSLSEKIKHVTQFEMAHLEDMGLLKMDYLGLKTLSVMREAIKTINFRHKIGLKMEKIPVHSSEIYDLMRAGKTLGIFQLEGAGMTNVLMEMQPQKFEHIVACISLFRPGPMEYIPQYIKRMHGQETVEYRHPDMRNALEETFGIIVYQESIMTIARDIAGYSVAEADTIRKAVGKKDPEALFKHREKFIAGAVAKGYDEELGKAIFSDIEFFARYGFNKAHAAAYALLSCRTAWLKANYPLEYLCAYLNSESEDKEKVREIISEVKRMGFMVMKPDVNNSEQDFVVKEDAIVFGLGGIKGLGDKCISTIISGRESGPYEAVEDVVKKASVNRSHLEALIISGAFDKLGKRRFLLDGIDSIIVEKSRLNKLGISGFTDSLFEDQKEEKVELKDMNDFVDPDLYALEKDSIGYNFVKSTDEELFARFKGLVNSKVQDMVTENVSVTIAARILSYKEITTKTGKPMAFVEVEDETARCEMVMFSDDWINNKNSIINGVNSIFLLTGRTESPRNNKNRMIFKSIKNVSALLDENKSKLAVFFDLAEDPTPFINALKDGRDKVYVFSGTKCVEIRDKRVPDKYL